MLENTLKKLVCFFITFLRDSVCCILILCVSFSVFSQYEYEVGLEARGYLNNEQNPFWLYSNQMGMVSEETIGLGILDGHFRRYLGEYFEVEAGGSLFMNYTDGGDNQIRGNEYYASLG